MGVSTGTVYARIRRGTLDVVSVGPILIGEEAVEEYLERDREIHVYQGPVERAGWRKGSASHKERERRRHHRAHLLRKLYPSRSRPA
jgi:hypothetical protein